MKELRSLRDYQSNAKADLDKAFADGFKRVILQGPCGFGKTLTAAHIAYDFISKGKRVCFVVPRLTLIDQSVDAFTAEGFDEYLGVIQGHHWMTDYNRLFQIASLQTLTRRKLPDIDLFIVDEAHMTSKAFLKLLTMYADVPVVGLSATPWKVGLGRVYDKLIIAETTAGLINRGYLVPFHVFAPAPKIDLDGVRVLSTGDYNQGQLSKAVNKKHIVGDIIKHWQRLGENRLTICFCVDRSHAKHVQERFEEAGVNAAYVDCFTEDDDRRQIIADFKAGRIRVIANVGILTTGFDCPEASCLIDAAPTKSLMLHVQKIGRVLRTAQGKTNAIILDHANNSTTLGLVTHINRDFLCDGTDESRVRTKDVASKEPLPRLCDECKTVVPREHNTCTNCGAKMLKFTTVVHDDGVLQEFGAQTIVRRNEGILAEQRREFFSGLKHYARQRGYKDGWAAFKFKERFGDWPNKLGVNHTDPKPPTIETLNWIRSRQIAYAKSVARG